MGTGGRERTNFCSNLGWPLRVSSTTGSGVSSVLRIPCWGSIGGTIVRGNWEIFT